MNSELRKRIDDIDEELVKLFAKRMEVSAEIAQYKKENGIPVRDAAREEQKLHSVMAKSPEELRKYAKQLYSLLFELSRSYQNRLNGGLEALSADIREALDSTGKLFPEEAAVACQGIEGAYSHIACRKLFRTPSILSVKSFDAVFTAIEKGLCRYGVLPVENNTAGTVNAVYDLMMQHHFHIVRSTRLKVDHNLLALPGAKLSDIREVWSHEQALSQCAGFLRSLPGVKAVPCENTAEAAKRVAESGRKDVASLSSLSCARYYNLSCLKENVQDQDSNYTRFICIGRDMEIYPGADRTSLMAVLPHEPGSLYRLLSKLYALNINLNKLESRPLPGREFEFMFYFDLDTSVYSPEFLELMDELPGCCERFSYLGSYSEVL